MSSDKKIEFGPRSFRANNDQVYFDLNDFDEAALAPVTWEIVRLACSIFVGFQSLGIEAEKGEGRTRSLPRHDQRVDSMAILTASSHIRSTGQDGSCSTDELKAFGYAGSKLMRWRASTKGGPWLEEACGKKSTLCEIIARLTSFGHVINFWPLIWEFRRNDCNIPR